MTGKELEEAAAAHWESAGPLTLDMIDLEDNKESQDKAEYYFKHTEIRE